MDWQPIDTIPRGRKVEVMTYKGLIAPTRIPDDGTALYFSPATPQYPKRRLACFRADKSGDIRAIAWREIA